MQEINISNSITWKQLPEIQPLGCKIAMNVS